jgi:hypothetical protein
MLSIAIYQVPRLLRSRQWRELAVFGLLWLISGAYAFMVAMRVPLPTLVEVVTSIYKIIHLPFLKTGA